MYSSLVDVRNALTSGGTVETATTAASLPDAVITDQIKEADALIFSYLSDYAIQQDPDDPSVATTPVRYWSRDIAAFLSTLVYKRSKDLPADEPIRLRFNIIMSLLTDIRDGKGSIDLPPAGGDDTDIAVVNLYEGHLWGPEDFNLAPSGNLGPGFGRWPGGW